VDVRIGVTQAPREITVEIDDSGRDDLRARVDAALSGATDVLWLDDRRGRQVAVPAAKIAYVELGSPEERRIGFGG
jgi:ABC-type glycerol-3-phosphate transport system substrate-binding protein